MTYRMKALLAFLTGMALSSTAGATLIENNTNLSADWTRMPARVAATDSVDAVLYNPAGTIRLGEGTFIMAGNQFLPKEYSHTKDGVRHETTTLTTVVPNLFAVKNSKKWSGFAGFGVIGGGGALEYENGMILDKASGYTVTQLAGLKAMGKPGPILTEEVASAWVGAYVGGACAVSDTLSLSLTGRLVYGTNTYEIDDGRVLDYEKTGTGFAPIIGLNYTPSPTVNIGFRHEFRTRVEWEVDKIDGSAAEAMAPTLGQKGHTTRKDFPAMTALGVSWKATEALTLATDVSYAWHDDIDWEGAEEGLDNGVEVACAFEYAVTPGFAVSAGYSYSNAGVDPENYSTALSKNVYHGISAGFMAEPVEGLRFNVGATKLFYEDDTDSRGITYEKDLWIIGIGVQYAFR
ncbi:OmpP1/FadL family transporter [Desulfoluna spongiiphila]|uniref:OmpP1/FadL family transporter n=1 Tax=Desulfoluna spongiiphila TaxID=419481 RepID=UPI001252BC22|nr:hypothetical protein [Desulfoluna spongiiphila]VVS93184.1 hypothetical protein DBB_27520 [Desulfoluna spongiiphila]